MELKIVKWYRWGTPEMGQSAFDQDLQSINKKNILHNNTKGTMYFSEDFHPDVVAIMQSRKDLLRLYWPKFHGGGMGNSDVALAQNTTSNVVCFNRFIL